MARNFRRLIAGRHSLAESPQDDTWSSDLRRKLTREGVERARAFGATLALPVDIACVSQATRTKQTAQAICPSIIAVALPELTLASWDERKSGKACDALSKKHAHDAPRRWLEEPDAFYLHRHGMAGWAAVMETMDTCLGSSPTALVVGHRIHISLLLLQGLEQSVLRRHMYDLVMNTALKECQFFDAIVMNDVITELRLLG